MHPNVREKASFLRENFIPIEESGQLRFVGSDLKISENMRVMLANGHTEKMMCPIISYGDKTIAYMADLIPSAAHIRPNYVMAYDIRPLITMTEREQFLKEAVEKNYLLFFEHDLNTEMATVAATDHSFRVDQIFHLDDICS